MCKQRIHWIDCVKGIGIIFVVFAHLSPSLPVEKFIYSFHVFLFFFVSGFLYRSNQTKSANHIILKKFISYMIPYFFWGILSSVYSVISGTNIVTAIDQLFILHGQPVWDVPIWFLWILFAVETLYLFIDKLPLNIKHYVFPFVCLFCAFMLRNQNLPLKIGVVPIGLFFYWLGLTATRINIFNKSNRIKYPLLAISLLVTTILSQINDRISVHNARYGNFILCVLCGISGVVFITILCNLIFSKHQCKLLESIGKNTMFIMCVQYPIFAIISSVSNRFIGIDLWYERGTVKAIAVSFLTIVIIYIIIIPILNRLPNVLYRLFGYKRVQNKN